MNLKDVYLNNPRSYVFAADGGFGKTTSMIHLAKNISDQTVNGRRIIPVYVRMKEINNTDVRPEVIFRFVASYYNDTVDKNALVHMIEKSRDEIQYLFLLDGFNEIINYVTDNDLTVLEIIFNDIRTLIQYDNVHVILSTRQEETIPEDVRNTVLTIRPTKYRGSRGLSDGAIINYLQDSLKEEDHDAILNNQMLRNPMFLIMFKKAYKYNPLSAVRIVKRIELFDQFFLSEFDNYRTEQGTNAFGMNKRKFLYEAVLPYIGFCEAKRILEKNKEVGSQETIQELIAGFDCPNNVSVRSIRNELITLRLCDENNHFYHDLYRDYFAAKGFDLILKNAKSDTDVTDVLKQLIQEIKYVDNNWMEDGDKYDFKRRLAHFDFAEFLYGLYDDQLSNALSEYMRVENAAAIELAENFYQELAGVYDDIGEGKEAASSGWIAFRLLNSRRSIFEGEDGKLALAIKLNFLYYCVNRDKERKEEAKRYLQEAEELVESINVSGLNKTRLNAYYRLSGKIRNNKGSHYFNLGREELEKNGDQYVELFLKAKECHQDSLEFREKADDLDGQIQSLRAIMGDWYYLKDYEQGYRCYKNANKLLQDHYSTQRNLPEDFIERAMGSELEILLNSNDESLKQEITEEISGQIKIVFNKCKRYPERLKEMIDSLKKKVDALVLFARDNHLNGFLELLEGYQTELRKISPEGE